MKLVANGPGIGDSMFLSAVAWEWLVQRPREGLVLSVAHPELYAGWADPRLVVVPWEGADCRTFPELDNQRVTGGDHNVRWMCAKLGLVPPALDRVRQWCPPLRGQLGWEARRFVDMLRSSVFRRPVVYWSSTEEEPVEERPPRPYITLSPKAGSWTPNKDWPLPFWQYVVSGLMATTDAAIAQLGAADDPQLAHVVDLRGIPLAHAVEVIRGAAVHVCVVTGTMHIASGTATPTVAIFGGREDPRVTGYPHHLTMVTRPSCAPCWLVEPCPFGSSVTADEFRPPCLHALQPPQVLDQVIGLYQRVKEGTWDMGS